MKVFEIEKSPLNFQKTFLSYNVYVNNYQQEEIALIRISNNYKILAKICLYEDKCIEDSVFVDKSVIVPINDWTEFDSEEFKFFKSSVTACDIVCIPKVDEAKAIDVIVITHEPKALIDFISFGETVCKSFLNQVFICKGCIVYNSSSCLSNVYAVIVTNAISSSQHAAKVTNATKICVQNVMSFQKYNVTAMSSKILQWDKLFLTTNGAQPDSLKKISSIVSNILEPSQIVVGKHLKAENRILLVGPSGCGKTAMIAAISRQLTSILLLLNCGDLKASEMNGKLAIVLQKANLYSSIDEKTIVVLKNIDRLFKKENKVKSARAQLLLNQLKSQLEQVNDNKISIVATTDSPENIHSDLRKWSCFNQEIEIAMLNEDDRLRVFKCLSEFHGLSCTEMDAAKVAQWTPGYILSDLQSVVREAIRFSKIFNGEYENVLKKAVSNTSASCLRGVRGLISTKKTTFADIGGLEHVKKQLKIGILWQMTHPEAFARLGVRPTKGVLLHGPPGCAKTTLVKALANESGATFLAASAADLYSPYVGESEKKLTKLFTQARIGAPAIVFIDEIDALVGCKGGSRESGVQERILATLLMEMDGVGISIQTSDSLLKAGAEGETGTSFAKKHSRIEDNSRIIVVGATNRLELLDDALKRPGRFDKLIHIPLPDFNERLLILQKLTSTMSIASDIDLQIIAERSKGFSGADLKGLCNEAGLSALSTKGMNVQKIAQSDFMSILEKSKKLS